MAKARTVFLCQNCGAQEPKWMGRCTSCGEWNTFVEEVITKEPVISTIRISKDSGKNLAIKPQLIGELVGENIPRFSAADQELDRALGGGFVPGAVVLIGGEPGIGKSTLLLQVALAVNKKVLYVSGEESEAQVSLRAKRITNKDHNLCYIMGDTRLENILHQVRLLEPELLIIDSIQTMQVDYIESAAGSVSQIRECSSLLIKYAKQNNVPVLLVGHITKDGSLAGPKLLEHMVDAVLLFEGDRHSSYRLLRTQKNRYGSTNELGIYEMLGYGLREVSNPSEILITQRDESTSGVAICAALEGNRALLIEVQALVSHATYGTPQRTSTGYDAKRLNMLIAVLEKRLGLKLGNQDVFLNIAGGLKVEDPAVDLAVCIAIASSYNDIAVPSTLAFCGEVGLGGEVRAVARAEIRIAEADKLGFKAIFLSKHGMPKKKDSATVSKKLSIKTTSISTLAEIIDSLFQ